METVNSMRKYYHGYCAIYLVYQFKVYLSVLKILYHIYIIIYEYTRYTRYRLYLINIQVYCFQIILKFTNWSSVRTPQSWDTSRCPDTLERNSVLTSLDLRDRKSVV